MRSSKKISRCAPGSSATPLGHTTASLARELGVAWDHVDRVRGETCVAGLDFDEVGEPSLLVFTESGAEKIRQGVAAQMVNTPPPPTVPAPAAESAQAGLHREDLRLTRVFRWSANLMAVRANGLEVVLTVKTNQHLQAGMVLRGCIEGATGWTYEGRLPRSLGERQLYFPTVNSDNETQIR
jgi:hypothetical protein